MIKNVKVSIVAVKEFERAIYSIENYSPKLSKCVSWFNECIQYISHSITKYRACIDELSRVEELLEEKKKDIDVQIEDLINNIRILEGELESLYEELNIIPETITIEEDGVEDEVDNPDYEVVENRINDINKEIEDNETQIELLHKRINHAFSVIENIYAIRIDVSEAISSFECLQEECQNCINEIERIMWKSIRNSEVAEQKTKHIQEIIGDYIRVKMKYEGLLLENERIDSKKNQTNAVGISTNTSGKTYSKEEIEAHDIKYGSAFLYSIPSRLYFLNKSITTIPSAERSDGINFDSPRSPS